MYSWQLSTRLLAGLKELKLFPLLHPPCIVISGGVRIWQISQRTWIFSFLFMSFIYRVSLSFFLFCQRADNVLPKIGRIDIEEKWQNWLLKLIIRDSISSLSCYNFVISTVDTDHICVLSPWNIGGLNWNTIWDKCKTHTKFQRFSMIKMEWN